MNTKQEHFTRINSRLCIARNKEKGFDKNEFLKSVIDEHFDYYSRKGFSIEEANKLSRIPNGVKEVLGERESLALLSIFREGDYDLFIKTLELSFLEKEQEIYEGLDLSRLFEQLGAGLRIFNNNYLDKKENLIQKINTLVGDILFGKEKYFIDKKDQRLKILTLCKRLDKYYFDKKESKFTSNEVSMSIGLI